MACQWCGRSLEPPGRRPNPSGAVPRMPCQGLRSYYLEEHSAPTPTSAPVRADRCRPAGTISWAEHLEACTAYCKSETNRVQPPSPERVAFEGGFGYGELCVLLGRLPNSWRRREGG